MYIRHQNQEIQKLQQQDSGATLDERIQMVTNTYYNREQEKEAKAQEKERKKELRWVKMIVALQIHTQSTSKAPKRKPDRKHQIFPIAGALGQRVEPTT